MIRISLLRCCTTPIFLKQYETSTDAVLKNLGVELIDIKEFNCCGYPLKNINFKAYILASSRNLSLAEKENLDIMTFCNCCYGSMKRVNHLMKEDITLRNEINTTLEKEGLSYGGSIEIKHLLEIFNTDIGIKAIRKKVIKPFKNLKIATHYGCHLLRPTEIVQFDNPAAPSIFDQLVEATGAESIPWQAKLDCCGSPMLGIDDGLSMDLMGKKITDAVASGADYLCTACSYCQLQFDRGQ